MKKQILFLLLTLFAQLLQAQTEEFYPSDKLALISPTNKSKGVLLGDDIKKAVQSFGQPTSIENFYFETDDKMGQLYTYKENKLYVADGRLISYEIMDNSIMVGKINGTVFKVGDKLKSTKKKVLKGPPGPGETYVWEEYFSFLDFGSVEKQSGISRSQRHDYIAVSPLIKDGIKYDATVQLYFNANKQLFYIGASLWH